MTSAESPFRFTFDDVVRVIGQDPELAPIRGELGVIVGLAEDPTQPGYGVWIYSEQRVWSVEEDEIEATGRVDPATPSPVVARVSVDEQGAGHLVGVYERQLTEGSGSGASRLKSRIFWIVLLVVAFGILTFG